jgi:hypothetical protein
MTDFRHCNNCKTYKTCLEQGCVQVRDIRKFASDPEDLERDLRQQLADLHTQLHRQAEPIIKQLASIEMRKLPTPVWMGAGQWAQFKPEVHAALIGKPVQAPENPGERMRRLEHERRQLLHLLRMVRSAGTSIPGSLTEAISHTLEDLDP